MPEENVNWTPETEAPRKPAAYCRACGMGLTQEEMRTVDGVVYCATHAPALAPPPPRPDAGASPWTAPPPPPPGSSSGVGGSPGLAFLLGLIPGVGAIYNAQYAKGFIHVVVTGLLISIMEAGAGGLEPLFGLLTTGWFFYMAFEAYHTAKKRLAGQPVDEFSSLFPRRGAAGAFPAVPVLLIALGVLFLLNNLELVRIRQILPYLGPILLIGLGVYMLYARLSEKSPAEPTPMEAPHERQ